MQKYVSDEELSRFTLVEADLLHESGWKEAVEGMDAILHSASPFIIEEPKHEDELIKPARMGVKHVMDAAIEKQVHRVVQTSSIAAIVYGHDGGLSKFDESHWTNLNAPNVSAYTKSKTLAEMDLWALSKKHAELKITTINPGFVLGPLLGKDPGTSGEVILKFMRGEYPGFPRLGFPIVDVRDVAELHYLALENEVSIGSRYIASSESIWFKNMAEYILEACPEFSSKVKPRQLPDWLVKLLGIFDKSIRSVIHELGFKPEMNNAKAVQELGFAPRSAKEATMATASSIVEMGYLNR